MRSAEYSSYLQDTLACATEDLTRNKKGKRVYHNDVQTRDLTKKFEEFFESTVEINRIRVGRQQTIETLVNEAALLFAKYLRSEKPNWVHRLVNLSVHLNCSYTFLEETLPNKKRGISEKYLFSRLVLVQE